MSSVCLFVCFYIFLKQSTRVWSTCENKESSLVSEWRVWGCSVSRDWSFEAFLWFLTLCCWFRPCNNKLVTQIFCCLWRNLKNFLKSLLTISWTGWAVLDLRSFLLVCLEKNWTKISERVFRRTLVRTSDWSLVVRLCCWRVVVSETSSRTDPVLYRFTSFISCVSAG